MGNNEIGLWDLNDFTICLFPPLIPFFHGGIREALWLISQILKQDLRAKDKKITEQSPKRFEIWF